MANNDISDTSYVAQIYDLIKAESDRWEALPKWAELPLDTQHKLVRDIASLVRRDIASLVRRAIEEHLDEHMQMYHDEAR
jgi:acyl-CoA reductase-like NAD-dependent aldehyde dehydrogenase